MKIAALLFASFLAFACHAAKVTESMARSVAEAWAGDNSEFCAGSDAVQTVVAHVDSDGVLLWYEVSMQRGVCIIVSPDTEIEPIVAVIDGYDGNIPQGHPLLALLNGDMHERLAAISSPQPRRLLSSSSSSGVTQESVQSRARSKWSKLVNESGGRSRLLMASSDETGMPERLWCFIYDWNYGILDHWNQNGWNKYVSYDSLYDKYTPNHYPCGCVATAGATLLQYYGKTKAPRVTNDCRVDGVTRSLTTKGLDYDWSLFESLTWKKNVELTEAQKDTLGRVTYDVGVCIGMSYAPGGSGASLYSLAKALRNDFGLADARYVSGIEAAHYEKLIYNQIRCGVPVALSIWSETSGHAVLAVGYGEDTSGTAYTRVFMGWGGSGDAWYALPEVRGYNTVDAVITMIGDSGVTVPVCARINTEAGDGVAFEQVMINDYASNKTSANGFFSTKRSTSPATYTVGCRGESKTVTVGEGLSSIKDYYSAKDIVGLLPDTVNLTIPAMDGELKVYNSPIDAQVAALAQGKALFVMSGAEWCGFCGVVKNYIKSLGSAFTDRYVMYYCDIDCDTYGMADGAPSYAVFDPTAFDYKNKWVESNGRLSCDRGGVESKVQRVLDDAWLLWESRRFAPSSVEVTGADCILGTTPYAITARFPDGTSVTITNGVSWSVVSGTAASISKSGVLTPAPGGVGVVTVRGYVELWGESFARTKSIRILDPSTIVELSVAGPDLIDLYDEPDGKYSAFVTCRDGMIAEVTPEWNAVGSDVRYMQISNQGDLSFSYDTYTVYQCATVTVSAVYGSFSNAMQTVIYGPGYVYATDYSFSQNAIWPGATIDFYPKKLRWWRHGMLEAPTDDLSGVKFAWSLNCPGDKYRSGDGMTFTVPIEATSSDGSCEVCFSTRPDRDRYYYSHGKWPSVYFYSSRPKMVNVSFDLNGAEGKVSPVLCVAGRQYGKDVLPICSRKGYNSCTWYTERTGGDAVSKDTIAPTSDITLFAHWSPRCYKLLFNANGGNGSMNDQWLYYDSKAAIRANTFTREGWHFVGWALSPTGEVVYTDGQEVLNIRDEYDEVTLYAVWKSNVYAIVSFNANGGAVEESTRQAVVGLPIGELPVPVREGYSFAGWYTDTVEGLRVVSTFLVDDTLRLYAHWIGKVTFGDIAYTDVTDAVSAAISEEKALFVLYGADWCGYCSKVKTYIESAAGEFLHDFVVYYCNGDIDGTMPESSYPTYASFDPAEFKSNWQDGCYYKSLGYSESTLKRSIQTALDARGYKDDLTFTINFELQGGESPLLSSKAAYGLDVPPLEAFELPRRSGYVFGGYFTEPYGSGDKYYNPDGTSARVWDKVRSITLYAQWLSQVFEITFDRQGGSGGSASTTAAYGYMMTRIDTPVRSGYNFGGYYSEPDGKGSKYYNADGTSAAEWNLTCSATLYAKWNVQSYVIAFKFEGGSGGTAVTSAKYGSPLQNITPPTRSNREFGGYFTAANGKGTKYYNADGSGARNWDIASATTLYAYWIADYCQITLDLQGGEGDVGPVYAVLGEDMPAILVPQRVGYRFEGFFSEINGGGKRYYNSDGSSSTLWDISNSTTLYAKWSAQTYRVTFDFCGGFDGTATVVAKYGDPMPTVRPPVRLGAVFEGYFGGLNGSGTKYYNADGTSAKTWDVTEEVTLFASWTSFNYTVAFDLQGGEGTTEPLSVIVGDELPAVNVPARIGYDFDGYFTEPNGSGTMYYGPDGKSVSKWDIAGSATLYAKWTPKSSPVILNFQSGSGGTTIVKAAYGSAMPQVRPPVRSGYSFVGYFTGQNGTGTKYYDQDGVSAHDCDFTSAMTLHACWIVCSCQVTLDPCGGVGGSQRMGLTFGLAMPAVVVPTRFGYVFGGYFTLQNGNGLKYYNADGTSARKCDLETDTTLYAYWTAITYRITIDMQGGNGSVENIDVSYGSAMPQLPIPVRQGYVFGGYFTELDGCGTRYYNADGTSASCWGMACDATLYAKWIAQSYPVVLRPQGGRGGTVSITATYGSPMPSITKPVRAGYMFAGYFSEEDGEGTMYYGPDGASAKAWDVASPVTLYAHWIAGRFKIILCKNDGTGTEEVVESECGKDCILPGGAKDLKWAPRRGFKFMGWSDSEKSKVVRFADKANVKDAVDAGETVRVYAIWQLDMAKSYAIQYIRNDGSGKVRTIGFNYGEERPLNSVAALGFARRGYTFGGWALSTDDARNKKVWRPDMGKVSTAAQPGTLLRVYAIWTLTPGYYSIRFNKNDGTGAWRELGYEYGSNTVLPTIENGLGWGREGYTFIGWMTSSERAAGGSRIWRTDKGVTTTPVPAGKTLGIYAVWAKNDSTDVNERPLVCAGADCAIDLTPVPVVRTVQAIAYFDDGDFAVVEASIESDGFMVVELEGSSYCGYAVNGVGELLGPDGGLLVVVVSCN